MSIEKFISVLQQRSLLSDHLMVKLREKIAESDWPLSAKALAKFLVQKNHLSQQQATEVLNALLLSGLDLDAALQAGPAAVPPADPHETVLASEPTDVDAEDDSESSSIFAPFLTGAGKKRRQAEPPPRRNDTDELQLVPDDEVLKTGELAGAAEGGDDNDLPTLGSLEPSKDAYSPPAVARQVADVKDVESTSVEIGQRRSSDVGWNSESLQQIDEAPAATPRRTTSLHRPGKKEPKKRPKPTKRRNPWDSPLMLLGGGALALLLLCGATVWWLLKWESGDQQLTLARAAMDSGAYNQAIEQYESFLVCSPRHPERSLARVQLAMVRIRQATESGSYSAALDLAQKELAEVEDEEAFDDAHGDLAALLPQIALRLAKQAEQAGAGTKEAEQFVEQTGRALELCSNVNYIAKSPETQLAVVHETLQRVERRQQTHRALHQALEAMQQAVAAGDPPAAYAAHIQLLKEHPEVAGDASLAEMIQKATASEQSTIHFVSEEQAAETAERPTPWVASLAVAHRRGSVPPAAGATGTACVRVDGAVYGLNTATGRLLWRRYVGFAAAPWPILIDGDVLVTDAARSELLRLDAATGRLLWHQVIGEPFAGALVVGERGFLAAESGRLYVVELKSGARLGYLQFAQPLRVLPAVDRQQERLYLTGAHSSLYSISLADLTCLGVYYLGHAEGSVRVPPAHVLDKLAVMENDGVETSRLHLFSLDQQGVVAKQEAERRLNGLAASPPLVAGRRLIVLTDRGQVEVYEIASGEGSEVLTLVATREAAGSQPLVRHVAVTGRNIWIGDTQLTKYSILPTGNRLPVETIDNNFSGATFDHPLELFGNSLIHVHRPKGRAGAVVAATDMDQGRTLWATELAMPPAGVPVVDDSAKTLTMANAEGSVFRFDEAALRSRVQDEPLAVSAMPEELPAITDAVDLGGGRAAFCAAGSDRLLMYNPSRSDQSAKWIKLESPLACAVTPFGEGLLAPSRIGQVFYLSSADGSKLATPFQPRLQPQTTLQYQPAKVVDAAARRFVIADGQEKIYVVAVVDRPQPHLEAVAEANSGPYRIESPVIVLGDAALAVAGGSHVVRFKLPSLEAAGESTLLAPVVWGPFRVGDAMLLATADEQLMAVSEAGKVTWQAPLEHGDLAGAPLALPDSVLMTYRKGIVERRAMADGKPLATLDLEQPLATGPVQFLQRIVLSAQDGTLLVVDPP